jgi:hypothetical protein
VYSQNYLLSNVIKKQNDFNFKLNSELIFTIFQKDKNCKDFNRGIFLYALFQDNYLFQQKGKEENKLIFNISFKDKKLNTESLYNNSYWFKFSDFKEKYPDKLEEYYKQQEQK